MREWNPDPNHFAIDLHRLLERYDDPSVVIHGLVLMLGLVIPDAAKDEDHCAELLDDAKALLDDRVEINMGFRLFAERENVA
jgi:hypothetical protein